MRSDSSQITYLARHGQLAQTWPTKDRMPALCVLPAVQKDGYGIYDIKDSRLRRHGH